MEAKVGSEKETNYISYVSASFLWPMSFEAGLNG